MKSNQCDSNVAQLLNLTLSVLIKHKVPLLSHLNKVCYLDIVIFTVLTQLK